MNSPNEAGRRGRGFGSEYGPPAQGGRPDPFEFDSEGDSIDLLAYWHIVNRQKWPILGLAAVVGAIAWLVAGTLTPIYQATAKLLIENQEANLVSIEQIYAVDANRRDYYQTQFQVMQSRKMAERVVDELELWNEPTFDPHREQDLSIRSFFPFLPEKEKPELTVAQRRGAAIGQFRGNLSISPVSNTQVVNIRFRNPDPVLAAEIANTLGEEYIDSYLESQLELTEKASSWLSERLEGMRQSLDDSEQRLQAFQEQENLVDISGVETLTADQLQNVSRRLVQARNRTAVALSQWETVQDAAGGYSDRWEELPGVVNDPPAQQYKRAETASRNEFNEIRQRYGPKHPKYISALSRLDAATQAYEERVAQVVRGFEEDYQLALAEQRRLEDELEARKDELQDIERKQFRLSELRRDADTNRQLYDMFFRRFRETNQTSFEAANARFIDRALPPGGPVEPNKNRIVGVAVMLALAAGIGLAFLRSMLDNTIKVASEIEEKLGQVVLGVVPLIELDKKAETIDNLATLYTDGGSQPFAEAVRSLRTSVVLSQMDTDLRVIVVTSSLPSEGKTTVSSNLAQAMGQMDKVLLLDGDMRRPSIGRAYEIDRQHPGLSELVAQTASLKECVQKCPEYGIDVLPAGTIPPNPLELLSSPRFGQVMSVLKEHYDRIIIDSPPTQAVSDSLVLSTHADGLIYVVKSDSTAVNVISNALTRLYQVGAPILGVTLNQFDASAASKYGYDGYDRYGYYAYGYSTKSYD